MAQLYTIYRALREDVYGRIEDLTPGRKIIAASTGGTFGRYDETAAKETAITSYTGRPRTMYLGGLAQQRNFFYFGNQYRGIEYTAPLIIAYPNTAKWNIAMADDAEQIRHDLNTNCNPSITGVQCRMLDPEAPPEYSENESDRWIYLHLSLLCLLEIG